MSDILYPGILCKVCGLTRLEDLVFCQKHGVALTGFIFVPASPRCVSPAFVASLPLGNNRRVGVMAGQDVAAVQRLMRVAKLDYVQLHGDESPNFCQAIGPDKVIKTLWPMRLSREALEAEMERFAPHVAFFLLDSGSFGGGSGKTQDWNSLYNLKAPKPWILAGGLGPHSLAEALSACTPAGVDLNSGLEDAPGIKSRQLMEKTFEILRTTADKKDLSQ